MPPTQAAVLVVGSLNMDYVVSVDRLPAAGETVTGGVFAQHPGGKGANQAVAAARLGAAVSFVGAVGDDDAGRSALADLRSEGVDAGRVERLRGVATGLALIVVDRLGENQIAVASGANARLDRASVERSLEGLRVRNGAVYLVNLEVSDEAVLAGARFAAANSMLIVINPAPARPLPQELLELRPILLPNSGEAGMLTGESDPEVAAARLAGRSGAPVVVTRGAEGVILCDGGEPTTLPAHRVEAVDTTGAGDTFAGAFAAELASGSTVEQSARVALAAAALSVTRAGPRAGMPRRDQLADLLH